MKLEIRLRNIPKIIGLIVFVVLFSNDIFSQSIDVNLVKGKDASLKKDYNLAIYYFDLVLKIDQNNIEALNERAHANNMVGNYKKAIIDYEFIISIEPNNTNAYFGLGSISETWLNDKYKAIEYYSKVISISLQNGDKEFAGTGYFMRADLKSKLNDKKGYMEDLKLGAELNHQSCKQLLELETQLNKF